jgi:hypothetical protein
MVAATPVFPGQSSTDQLAIIMKVFVYVLSHVYVQILGTPTKAELSLMNPTNKVSALPAVTPKTISKACASFACFSHNCS